MEALILAGGQGTRLKPYTTIIPKPLMPIGDMPILEIVLRQLAAEGFRKVYLSVNHLAELIRTFFGNGGKLGLKIEYLYESQPLGTMGPLRLIKKFPERLLIVNGDTLTDLSYRRFIEYHSSDGGVLTIASHRREVRIDFGVLQIDEKARRVKGFKEKPVIDYRVCMGVNAVTRGILDYVPEGRRFGFDELVCTLLEKKKRIGTYVHDGYWLDIGRHDDYEKANEEFDRERFLGA